MTNPAHGFDLLFSNGVHDPETLRWSGKIWYFRDQQSFFVIRVAAIFDLLTFSSYSGTAVLFAVVRSEEHTSELQSRENLVCRLLLEKKKTTASQSSMHIT